MNECAKEDYVTTREMIEYLQTFPPKSELKIFVIDTHEERKYMFRIENLSLITDEEKPVVFIDINRYATHDITAEVEESTD